MGGWGEYMVLITFKIKVLLIDVYYTAGKLGSLIMHFIMLNSVPWAWIFTPAPLVSLELALNKSQVFAHRSLLEQTSVGKEYSADLTQVL